MLDIILDTIIDGLKILPFLFVAFFIIELVEHKFSKKSLKIIEKSGRLGPLVGGILGCLPQCGFSVLATNFYVTRIITLGTLISVYLSTSDEMLPILMSHGSSAKTIFGILGIKVLIGIVVGFIVDLFIKRRESVQVEDLCEEAHCHCDDGLFKSSIVHTFHTLFFIVLVSFGLNIIMHFGGKDVLSSLFGENNFFTPFVASLIGLIPNCASSVVITELYLNGVLSISSVIAGLLTGSGVALLVLFKSNKNLKENIKILLIVYFVGAFSGVLLNLIGFVL